MDPVSRYGKVNGNGGYLAVCGFDSRFPVNKAGAPYVWPPILIRSCPDGVTARRERDWKDNGVAPPQSRGRPRKGLFIKARNQSENSLLLLGGKIGEPGINIGHDRIVLGISTHYQVIH